MDDLDKYFNGEYLKFHVTNEDGTFDETIRINEHAVEDVKDVISFLKATCEDNLADKMFEVFIEFALVHSVNVLNNNRKSIVKMASGEDNGN